LPNCVGSGRPGDGWRTRSRLAIAADTPVVLLYTRFFEFSQERLHLLLGEIRRRVPSVRLLVIGKGRHGEEEQLVAAAAQHDFQHVLLPAGWLEPEVIPDYLAAADVAIYPLDDNLVNRAKCPAKLTELLAAGVPVVADAVGQATEYINNGETGLLCRPGDWRQMADNVVALLEDRHRRRALGEACRQYLLEHFSWRQFVSKLDRFYHAHRKG